MLKVLQRRIVTVLTVMVVLLLSVVILSVYMITSQQLVKQQREALQIVSMLPMNDRVPEGGRRNGRAFKTYPPYFTVRVTSDGEIGSVFSRLFDITEDEMIAATHAALAMGKPFDVLQESSLRFLVRKDGKGMQVSFISTAEDEHKLNRLVAVSLLIGAFAALILFFGISLPLSRWLIAPTSRAWKQQKQFIADASHELKTPLTVIMANLSILRRHSEKPIAECSQWLNSTEEEAAQMRELVDEMLCLARAENSTNSIQKAECNLSDVFERVILAMEPLAFEQNITLHSSIQEQITGYFDADGMRRMVQSLLDNALKYAGGERVVDFDVHLVRDQVSMTVRNTGEPIPPEVLTHIFERFYRSDAARSSAGFGLGMAIARQIVQNHHGRISISSTRESGTVVTVMLPKK